MKRKLDQIKFIFSVAVAIIILVSLLTFDPNDVKFLTSSPNTPKSNVIGAVGAYLAWFLFFLIGLGGYIIPLLVALYGITVFIEEKPKKIFLRVFGALFLILALSSVLSLLGPQNLSQRFQRGGIVGLIFSDFLVKYLGNLGAFIIIGVLFLLALIIATDFLVFSFFNWLMNASKSFLNKARTPLSFKTTKADEAQTKASRPKKEAFPTSLKIKSTVLQPKKAEPAAIVKSAVKASPAQTKESPAETKEEEARKGPYKLPGLELLKSSPSMEEREIKEDLEETSSILEETLMDFDIEAKVVDVSKGPVITRYELEPARGVTISRITALSDNIALSMKAASIRIVAPIPGKGTVGVEVPNLKRTAVYLKEIIESKEYKESASKLKLALGKDISGAPIITDLAEMPHLLIAGATGSGKTVCVNSIITTLLYNASPDELRLLMVDPKRVELAVFNNLPHLLAPVVTEPKKVSHALDWVVNEMERRFELFAELGVKNIDSYLAKQKNEGLAILPYIIVIIDELADLMLVAQQEVESTITRLAQLSRAVGIHMIIATQRPSVDVITGVIKANFPARISFKVASKVDSRTVIDMNGAEKLLGKGDMLFLEPGNPKPIRAQGCLVTDEEINKLTTFIKSQRKTEFEEGIIRTDAKASYRKFEKDEVYEEAVKLVIQTRQASVSMLQRRLGVGYTRAARLIDMMEDDGIVGPYQGSKPRDILVDAVEEKEAT